MSKAKILVATDFSEDAAFAIEQAVANARMTNAEILLVHVAHAPSAKEGEGMLHGGAYADDSAALELQLKDSAEAIDGVACTTRLLRGDPAKEILRTAEEECAAMIVMGTHGRTGLARMLMGSVAEQVVRRADCSVLVVKRSRRE